MVRVEDELIDNLPMYREVGGISPNEAFGYQVYLGDGRYVLIPMGCWAPWGRQIVVCADRKSCTWYLRTMWEMLRNLPGAQVVWSRWLVRGVGWGLRFVPSYMLPSAGSWALSGLQIHGWWAENAYVSKLDREWLNSRIRIPKGGDA